MAENKKKMEIKYFKRLSNLPKKINNCTFEKAFDKKLNDSEVKLPGVVSRKKQVVPPLTEAFEG